MSIITIQSTDLITNSRADINTNFSTLQTNKIETSVIDTDTALAANSDAKLPSQKAVKAYVDAATGAIYASGKFTKALNSAVATTIAHGLGAAPRLVRIVGMFASGTNPTYEATAYTTLVGGIQNSTYQWTVDNVSGSGTSSSGQTFNIQGQVGTVSVDATNITIAWSGAGISDTGNFVWEAQK